MTGIGQRTLKLVLLSSSGKFLLLLVTLKRTPAAFCIDRVAILEQRVIYLSAVRQNQLIPPKLGFAGQRRVSNDGDSVTLKHCIVRPASS